MSPAAVPLVLIHGVGLDHTMWLPVMSALPHRRSITYDMIGHGAARMPMGPYTLDTFVDQLAVIVNALDTDVDVVGFSMGALVAQGFALTALGRLRLRRMVLLNGVHDRNATERQAILDRVADVRAGQFEETVEPALQRWFTPSFARARPEVIESVRACLLRNDRRAYAYSYEVFATADVQLAPRSAEITVPTLVATGAADRRSTPAMAEALAAAFPRGRSVILHGLRHLTSLEAPQVVAGLIDVFTAT